MSGCDQKAVRQRSVIPGADRYRMGSRSDTASGLTCQNYSASFQSRARGEEGRNSTRGQAVVPYDKVRIGLRNPLHCAVLTGL